MKLTVYKASAGSGKTYTLAYEYLRLALSKPATDQTFRSVLAVTFTNKATEEMKSRILSLLNLLAQGKAPSTLTQELQSACGCTSIALQERALNLRGAILHGYSDFSILTIDRFFQRILQAFIREAGLRPGYAIELDSDRLLDESVAKVMEDAGSDKKLRDLLLSLVEDNISTGKSWDITPLLRALGYEIFKESYLYLNDDFRNTLEDKELLSSYIEKIKTLKVDFESRMKSIVGKALAYLAGNGLSVDDFKNKKAGVAGYFLKLDKGEDYTPGKRALAAINNPDEWSSKAATRSVEVKAAYHVLNPLLIEAVELWQHAGILYNTSLVLLKNFKLIGLLSDMARNIRLIAGEENLLPISDSVYLLSKLIGDSDAPFIYEKAGNRFHHFMMDEFQDTSTGQWQNFRPLLHNSLSAGNFNMVVGDVKQSIYRWRNGDWKILGQQLAHDFATFGISEQNLNANWRSSGVVVGYNNRLFTKLSESLQASINQEMEQVSIPADRQALLQRMLSNAYSTTKQQVAKIAALNDGYVQLELLENTDEKDADTQVLERIPQLVMELQDRGYEPGDIAILVRRGVEGQAVANALLSYKQTSGENTTHCFDVISQDSLFLSSSPIVKLAISILRLAVSAGDKINEAYLVFELASRRNAEKLKNNLHDSMVSGLSEGDRDFIKSLSYNSISESFEQLVQYFELNGRREDLPFLQELHDVILKFSSDKLSDIASFLRWWDEKASAKKVLAANDKQNAIKILTIHKSKGLQFKAVIVPFCTWSLVPKSNTILWLQPTVEPFSDMPYLPVSYSSALAETIFYEDYFNEKAQSYVDNLNLLYVAFTRAEVELYAMVPQPARKQEESIANLLTGIVQSAGEENTPFQFGDIVGQRTGNSIAFGSKKIRKVDNSEKNQQAEVGITRYPSSPIQNKLRIKYEAQTFFGSEDEAMSPRAYGMLMHRVFSSISTLSDAEYAVEQLIEEGLIEVEERQLYKAKLAKALTFPEVQDWFSDEWEVRTEASFILPGNGAYGVAINRPDRVIVKKDSARVIDYKFGAVERSSYRLQLYAYLQGLQKMGYTDVKGYIWYVDREKIDEVLL